MNSGVILRAVDKSEVDGRLLVAAAELAGLCTNVKACAYMNLRRGMLAYVICDCEKYSGRRKVVGRRSLGNALTEGRGRRAPQSLKNKFRREPVNDVGQLLFPASTFTAPPWEKRNTNTTRYPHYRKNGARKVKEERRAGQQPDERQVWQGEGRGYA